MVQAIHRHPAFLDRETCRLVRAAMDRGTPDEAEVLDETIEPRVEVRRADSIEVAPSIVEAIETHLDAARDSIARFFGVALAEREGAGFLRYRDGGFYATHHDRADVPSWPGAARRSIAVVVFLNDSRSNGSNGEFAGGTLRLFAGERIDEVEPREGLLVAFPADVLHEVTEVRGGTRDAIVDWFYGPL